MKTYSELRSYIRTGGALNFRGNKGIARAIKLYSKYTHTALILRLAEYQGLKNHIFLVEALEHGLELNLMSERIKDYKGELFYFDPEGMTKDQRSGIRDYAIFKCATTKGYDYKSLIANALGYVNHDIKKYICSEFYWDCLLHVNFVKPHPKGKTPRPGDIDVWVPGNTIQFTP